MKTGRNDPCPCGSGKKYKHCCYAKDTMKHDEPVIAAPESSDPDVESDSQAESHVAPETQAHHKDRSRFQGEVRGGSSGFRPRATRGAQRGS
jgi:hypothetical protein